MPLPLGACWRRMVVALLLIVSCFDVCDATPLRVIVTGDPPFVVKQPDGTWDGISMRTWQAVAARCGVDFQVVGSALADPALAELAAGRVDVVVGPVGVTAQRARLVEFSRAYFHAWQGIACRQGAHGWFDLLVPYLLTGGILLVAMLTFVFVVGNGVWLMERQRNPQHFPRDWSGGVASGMWLAVVTITSVGYGDRVPATRAGRVFMAFWMVMAMLFASTLTASLTTMLTTWRVESDLLDTPARLAGHRVASVAGSSSAVYARQWAADVIGVKDIDTAMNLLLAKRVDAVVFHQPETQDWLVSHTDAPVHLATIPAFLSEYAFAFPHPRPGTVVPPKMTLVERVNLALLQMRDEGELARLQDSWLGRDTAPGSPAAAP